MRKDKLDLGEMINGIADQMAPLADDKMLTMQRKIAPGVLVEGDQIRLKQVGVNLLDNAFKYTPEGGQVSIRVWAESDFANFSISDTGMGISEQALPRIFDRFFRAEQARNCRADGTGLGLSIVQSIVEAHGGKVLVESQEGLGARFRIELPLVKRQVTVMMERNGVGV
jgi:signal transduction histidine kinase